MTFQINDPNRDEIVYTTPGRTLQFTADQTSRACMALSEMLERGVFALTDDAMKRFSVALGAVTREMGWSNEYKLQVAVRPSSDLVDLANWLWWVFETNLLERTVVDPNWRGR